MHKNDFICGVSRQIRGSGARGITFAVFQALYSN